MTASAVRHLSDPPYDDDPQPVLCYAAGMGLLGLAVGFVAMIGTFVVVWSMLYANAIPAGF